MKRKVRRGRRTEEHQQKGTGKRTVRWRKKQDQGGEQKDRQRKRREGRINMGTGSGTYRDRKSRTENRREGLSNTGLPGMNPQNCSFWSCGGCPQQRDARPVQSASETHLLPPGSSW